MKNHLYIGSVQLTSYHKTDRVLDIRPRLRMNQRDLIMYESHQGTCVQTSLTAMLENRMGQVQEGLYSDILAYCIDKGYYIKSRHKGGTRLWQMMNQNNVMQTNEDLREMCQGDYSGKLKYDMVGDNKTLAWWLKQQEHGLEQDMMLITSRHAVFCSHGQAYDTWGVGMRNRIRAVVRWV